MDMEKEIQEASRMLRGSEPKKIGFFEKLETRFILNKIRKELKRAGNKIERSEKEWADLLASPLLSASD